MSKPTTPDPPLTAASIRSAKRAQLTEQAAAFAQIRMRQVARNGDVRDLTDADQRDIRDAAERFVLETERDGPYMLARAKAEDAAIAHLRMRLHEDAFGTPVITDATKNIPRHWRASIAAYRRQLAIYEPPIEELSCADDDTGQTS